MIREIINSMDKIILILSLIGYIKIKNELLKDKNFLIESEVLIIKMKKQIIIIHIKNNFQNDQSNGLKMKKGRISKLKNNISFAIIGRNDLFADSILLAKQSPLQILMRLSLTSYFALQIP